MSGLASASTPSSTFPCNKILRRHYVNPCNSVMIPRTHLCSSDLCLKSFIFFGARVPQKRSILCRSSTGPGAPNSGAIALSISCTRFPLVHFSGGDNESRNVLDAFFLGKALAEALNERIESTIGEFLSTVGRLQAEQQKQVLDFQEEVLERAKRAKEKAAREALEAQGLILKSTAVNSTSVTNGAASKASPSTSDDGVSANLSSDNPANPAAYTDPNPAKGE